MTRKLKSGSPLRPARPDGEQLLHRRRPRRRHRVDHALSPHVHATLDDLLPDSGHRVLTLEIPAEAPDRVQRDKMAVRGNPSWSVLHTAPPSDVRARHSAAANRTHMGRSTTRSPIASRAPAPLRARRFRHALASRGRMGFTAREGAEQERSRWSTRAPSADHQRRQRRWRQPRRYSEASPCGRRE